MLKYRNICHYLAGIVTAMGCLVHWSLVLGGIILFVCYEVNEDWHWGDEAYRDILEFMIGFFVALGGLIIWEVLT